MYLAEQVGEAGFVKRVAVKVLNSNWESEGGANAKMQDEVQRRLRDEARLLATLTHHAIVRVHDLVSLGGSWAIVMEYVEGASLQEIAKTEIAVPPAISLEIVADVAAALAACWEQVGANGEPLRLLHRDIKPANIVLGRDGGAKVLDFGIAKAEDPGREAQTRTAVLFSPGYTAPERFAGENGPEADIFSLGIVLFELLLSERFAESFLSERKHVARLSFAQGTLAEAGLPPAVGELLVRALSFSPEDRPTAAEISRTARALSRSLPSEDRADWSRAAVAAVVARRERVYGEFEDGSTILESTGLTGSSSDSGPVVNATPNAPQAPEMVATQFVGGAAALGGKPGETTSPKRTDSPPTNELPRSNASRSETASTGVPKWIWAAGTVAVLGTILFLGAGTLGAVAFSNQVDTRAQKADAAMISQPRVAEAKREAEARAAEKQAAAQAPTGDATGTVNTPPSIGDQPKAEDKGEERAGTRSPEAKRPATGAAAAAPPVEATAEKPAEVVASCVVGLAGDVARVEARSGGKSIGLPGSVPAGSYILHMQREQDAKPFAASGSVSLCETAKAMSVKCLAGTKVCRVE